MKVVVLSGGSGSRLWPLSNESRSKQFLKVLSDANGEKESMAYRMYRQLRLANRNTDILFLIGASQENEVKKQLGSRVSVVIEPDRRGTFPAVLLACSDLLYQKKCTGDDVVVVIPVDVGASDYYYSLLSEMEKRAAKGEAELILMGITPTYPSAKYGYILKGKEAGYAAGFVEKPTEEAAAELMRQGALWNAGVFAFQISFLQRVLADMGCPVSLEDYPEVVRRYAEFEKESFDKAVVEKCTSVGYVENKEAWRDLGTWNTLTEEMQDVKSGEVIMGEECENTHVINELSIPIVVLGAKDMVVAASPDGILVSDKHKSSYLSPYVEQVKNRPMYEERGWGEYKVLDYIQYEDGSRSLTKHLTIEPGQKISYQSHSMRDEIWTIVDGMGELLIDGQVRVVKRGDIAHIIKGQKHAMRALTTLHFIEVQIGNELIEEDIKRYEWEWNE